MSAADWHRTMTRINFYAGALAERGNEYMALIEAEEVAQRMRAHVAHREIDPSLTLPSPLTTPLPQQTHVAVWPKDTYSAPMAPVMERQPSFYGETPYQSPVESALSSPPPVFLRPYTKAVPCPDKVSPSGSSKTRARRNTVSQPKAE